MEKLKLNFDAEILGKKSTLVVEVPYRDGVVATSELCPVELLAGSVALMAAVRGESLDAFMADCRRQLLAMSNITEADTRLDCHIGALMAVVLDHLSRSDTLTLADILNYVDCFSLLLKADGFPADQIREIYPCMVTVITDLRHTDTPAADTLTSANLQ